jgi:hypothetical protein
MHDNMAYAYVYSSQLVNVRTHYHILELQINNPSLH